MIFKSIAGKWEGGEGGRDRMAWAKSSRSQHALAWERSQGGWGWESRAQSGERERCALLQSPGKYPLQLIQFTAFIIFITLTSGDARCTAQLPSSPVWLPLHFHPLIPADLISIPLISAVWMSHSKTKKIRYTSLYTEVLLCVRHYTVHLITYMWRNLWYNHYCYYCYHYYYHHHHY